MGLVGLGGLGSHLAQQLAYLGVTHAFVDGDKASSHSLNRLVTASPEDINEYKTDLAERMIRAIKPDTEVTNVPYHLPHTKTRAALAQVDLILGGFDHDAPRLQLTDLASADRIVYIDAATDVHTGLRSPATQLTYRADQGGVRINLDPPPCPQCPTASAGAPAERLPNL